MHSLIQRRPGQYPQAWLAKRLGVTARSIYSYHQAENIVAEPCFETTPLTWDNLETMLDAAVVGKRLGVDTRGWFSGENAIQHPLGRHDERWGKGDA